MKLQCPQEVLRFLFCPIAITYSEWTYKYLLKYCKMRDVFGILIKMVDSNLVSRMYSDLVEKCGWEGDSI
jgi:hypothetical protein